EPSAVKVARWVLRGATLGNRCRLLDINLSPKANAEAHVEYTAHRGSTAEDRQVFFNMLTDFE
ncbi:hypothetical protein R7P66_20525, partial [Vibrio sp. Vb0587]|nr:hypothetical protein [Vibrio sp. Vb0587]